MSEATSQCSPEHQVHRSPLSDSDRSLMAMPAIASQMPVKFKSGACWEGLEGVCNGCRQVIPSHLMSGRITRLMEPVATVEAVGVCPSCRLLTRFHYRLHDDMRITGMTDRGWATWRAESSAFDRLRAWHARTLQRAEKPNGGP